MFFKNTVKRQYLKAKRKYEEALKAQDWTGLNDIEFELVTAERELIEWAFTRCEKNKIDLTAFKDNWVTQSKTLIDLALNMR